MTPCLNQKGSVYNHNTVRIFSPVFLNQPVLFFYHPWMDYLLQFPSFDRVIEYNFTEPFPVDYFILIYNVSHKKFYYLKPCRFFRLNNLPCNLVGINYISPQSPEYLGYQTLSCSYSSGKSNN